MRLKLPLQVIALAPTPNTVFVALRKTGDINKGDHVGIVLVRRDGMIAVQKHGERLSSDHWHKMDAFAWHSEEKTIDLGQITAMISEGSPANDNED